MINLGTHLQYFRRQAKQRTCVVSRNRWGLDLFSTLKNSATLWAYSGFTLFYFAPMYSKSREAALSLICRESSRARGGHVSPLPFRPRTLSGAAQPLPSWSRMPPPLGLTRRVIPSLSPPSPAEPHAYATKHKHICLRRRSATGGGGGGGGV